MKRSLPLLLALVCVLSLTACRGDIGQPAAKPVLYLYPEKETAVGNAGLRRGADLHLSSI